MIKVMMSSTTQMAKDGITNAMLNLYKNINKNEFHVDFITINEPEKSIKEFIFKYGGNYTVINREINHPLRYILSYKKMCKGYDVVHVHGNSATMILEMVAATIAGVKVRIAHSHNTYCVAKIVDWIFRLPFYLLCNCYLACGNEAGHWLFGNRDFKIINNGVDTENFRFNSSFRMLKREELDWEDKKIIGHVGNFLEAKNHKFILDLFSDLVKVDNEYRLLLIGDGNLKYAMINKAEKSKIYDKVKFLGSIDSVSEYLNAIDIIIMPSINEGFPLTLIEEQANGLTCLISDNITQDVNLSDNIYFLSLRDVKEKWISLIKEKTESVTSFNRDVKSNKAISDIIQKNYDIRKSALSLENIYRGCLGEIGVKK